MSFFQPRKEKSLITSGSKIQREALALLIERGLQMESDQVEILSHHEFLHPDQHDPLIPAFSPFFGWGGCANLIGLAVMGLQGDFPQIAHEYLHHRSRLSAAKRPAQNIPYAAASEMLGLPVQLLWDTQFQNFFGMDFAGVLDELRRD